MDTLPFSISRSPQGFDNKTTQDTRLSQVSRATRRVMEQLTLVPRVWNPEESVGMHTDAAIVIARQYHRVIEKFG